MNWTPALVHAAAAVLGATVARHRVLIGLELELVVVEELLAGGDVALGVDGDPLHAVRAEDASEAVRVARVVDEARQAALQADPAALIYQCALRARNY